MALFIRYITYNGTRYSYSSFEQRTRSSSLRDYSITLKSAFPKNGAFYLIKNSSFDFDDANSLSAPSSSDVMNVADIADMPYNYTPSDKATIRSDYANRRRVRYTYSSKGFGYCYWKCDWIAWWGSNALEIFAKYLRENYTQNYL